MPLLLTKIVKWHKGCKNAQKSEFLTILSGFIWLFA